MGEYLQNMKHNVYVLVISFLIIDVLLLLYMPWPHSGACHLHCTIARGIEVGVTDTQWVYILLRNILAHL